MQRTQVMLQKCSRTGHLYESRGMEVVSNLVITECIVETLRKLDMRYPEPSVDITKFTIDD